MRTTILATLLGVALLSPAARGQGAAPAPTQAPAAASVDFKVEGGASSLTYHLVHKAHKVDGVSKKVEGKARMLPDGKVQVMLRAPVESFDSANANRDAHMKETVEAARYPTVEVKAAAEGLAMPASFPTTVQKTFTARVTLHGVERPVSIPVKVVFESPQKIVATANFSVSLEGHKIERPSLLLIKVEDDLRIDASVTLTR